MEEVKRILCFLYGASYIGLIWWLTYLVKIQEKDVGIIPVFLLVIESLLLIYLVGSWLIDNWNTDTKEKY